MMVLQHQPHKFTHDDYLRYPEDQRVELINGEFHMCPAPLAQHQRVSLELSVCLHLWVKEHHLGEVFVAPMDVIFSKYNVLQPDILFVSNENVEIIKKWVHGSPDLVVEILSPSDPNRDTILKKEVYSNFGVKEYWIIDPTAETISVYVYKKNRLEFQQTLIKGSLLESTVVAGFRLNTAEIFV